MRVPGYTSRTHHTTIQPDDATPRYSFFMHADASGMKRFPKSSTTQVRNSDSDAAHRGGQCRWLALVEPRFRARQTQR